MRPAPRYWPLTSRALATALGAVALLICGVASAGHEGGGNGGGHSGGGGHAAAGAGHAGGAPHAAYGYGGHAHYYRGGAPGGTGYRPRAGYVGGGYYHGPGYGHGGYWHGGYWHSGYGGYWHGHYWGGVGIGLYFATLPWYYETYWWGGVPYYYADYSFYRWNDAVGQYETVAPPADDGDGAGPAAGAGELYVYPKQHQSEEQLQRDRYDCHRWAADQTGFDPTRANGGVSADSAPAQAGAYRRAESACLEGRGYTVR